MTGLDERIRQWNARGLPFWFFVGFAIFAAVVVAPFGVPALLRAVYNLSLAWSPVPIFSFAVALVAAVAFLFAATNLWLRSAGYEEVLDVTPPSAAIRSARSAALTLGLGLLGLSIGINIGKTIFT